MVCGRCTGFPVLGFYMLSGLCMWCVVTAMPMQFAVVLPLDLHVQTTSENLHVATCGFAAELGCSRAIVLSAIPSIIPGIVLARI